MVVDHAIWCHGAGARHRSEVIISDDEAVDAVGATEGREGTKNLGTHVNSTAF